MPPLSEQQPETQPTTNEAPGQAPEETQPKPTAQTAATKQSPPLELDPDTIFKRASMGRRYRYDDSDLGTVWIKRLSASEVSTLQDSLDRDAEGNVDDPYGNAKLIQVAILDSQGNQKFTVAQIPNIAAMANAVLVPLAEAVMDRNAMTRQGIEAIRKNCEATPGSDSV
jgi:hypothetical protein